MAPNQPRADNKVRSIRVTDDLWDEAQIRAAAEGETVSDVVRAALVEYLGHD